MAAKRNIDNLPLLRIAGSPPEATHFACCLGIFVDAIVGHARIPVLLPGPSPTMTGPYRALRPKIALEGRQRCVPRAKSLKENYTKNQILNRNSYAAC
jgi:hypothetical protein